MESNKNNVSDELFKEKSWEEFRNTGLPIIVNQFLHAFGWAIAFEIDEDKKVAIAFPARVKYRGFGEEIQDEAYKKVAKYLSENSSDLLSDTEI